MKVSASELAALAGKAARGAGAPPGQAADFGAAVVVHLAAGRDADELRRALEALPRGVILRFPLEVLRALEGGVREVAHEGFAELLRSYAEAQPFACTVAVKGEALGLGFDVKAPSARGIVSRIDLPEVLGEVLHGLAANTFVPESAASRLAGAGAGLTDND